ncbi:response regulator transcription factor [Anoxynatronum buryatiense]|uniref:Stage 0 sporulation protein A homolog n=1 Tax=Anoxynatronum buryatiense TaxID=489973 RepID=A0AA46AJI9_9CLOT|nr:response regulator transcription factor [Anoxynatronum buryatiense]SMP62756.1 two component transcriptional regulator, LuxR family [Anoxynatronum buryatiense]
MSENEEKVLKIFLVDDHAIVRSGIRSLIERSEGMTVCGEAGTLKEAYAGIPGSSPDIVLLDIKLPDGDGASGCREIKKQNPHVKVMILSAFAEDTIVLEAIKSGAEGYLLKSVDSKSIIKGLRDVAQGNPALDPVIMAKVMNAVKEGPSSDETLSLQEQQIIELVSQGKTNREISEVLFISEKTARNNVSRILKKLNASNRTEAAMYWQKRKTLR